MVAIPTRNNCSGFTMVQLLVVIFVVGLVVTLLVPAVQKVRMAAARTETINHLKDLCLALHKCNGVHGRLPPAYDKFAQINFPASIHVHLLPFLDPKHRLYADYLAQQGNGNAKDYWYQPFLSGLDYSRSPKDTGIQNFAANLRVFSDKGIKTAYDADLPPLAAVEPGTASIPKTFVDGMSNTAVFSTKLGVCGSSGGSRYAAEPNTPFAAFFGEVHATVLPHPSDPKAAFQLAPDPGQCLTSPLMAQSFEPTGILVGLADGGVRTLPPDFLEQEIIDDGVKKIERVPISVYWNLMLCPNDGRPLFGGWDF